MAANRNIHPRQFGGEVSREGKPKRAHPTQAAAQAVADLHKEKYGTIATTYQGRDNQWYVTTDRQATADAQRSDENKRRVERMVELQLPRVASDIRTRRVVHVGTRQNTANMLAAMNPKSPLHGAYLKWVADHPLSQPGALG
jgi:hypothetical protein